MFAGYDLFREARIRRFSARQPESAWRSQLLQRLYPYMARSPVAQSGFTRQFFGNHSDHWREPGFGHSLRWQTTRALRRLFHPEFRTAAASTDVIDRLLRDLPAEFGRWPYLTQDQHLEIRTLLSGYLLSSQGDRMLTAHSVEGRFPFLDANVAALADSLPPDYKLRGLDEKRVLKRAADGLVPSAILARRKQPYRAPDALSFVDGAPDWVAEVLSPRAVEDAGVFSPGAVTQLWAKLQNRRNAGQFSNADNMGFVGVLSTQLLHRQLVARRPQFSSVVRWTTIIDRVATTQETAPV
jgi:asparagine synthase (glutamine-hydrolysing)